MRKLAPHEILRPSPEALARLPRRPLSVVLDRLRSAHNVGAIFRTADAFRLAHVYCTGYTPRPGHPGVAKTALGAEHTVPWSYEPDPRALLARLRAEGSTLAALEQTDRPSAFEDLTQAHFPLVLVVGNEVEGVAQELLGRCQLALEIPQFGAKHSLNVSVAFGIAAYAISQKAISLMVDRG